MIDARVAFLEGLRDTQVRLEHLGVVFELALRGSSPHRGSSNMETPVSCTVCSRTGAWWTGASLVERAGHDRMELSKGSRPPGSWPTIRRG